MLTSTEEDLWLKHGRVTGRLGNLSAEVTIWDFRVIPAADMSVEAWGPHAEASTSCGVFGTRAAAMTNARAAELS